MTFPKFFRRIRETISPLFKKGVKLFRPVVWPIIKALRRYGFGYKRTKQILKDLDLIQPGTDFEHKVDADYQMLEKEKALRDLGVNDLPGYNNIVEYDFGRAEHYRWILRVIGVSRLTGQSFDQFISLYTNRLMTSDELIRGLDFRLFEGTSGEMVDIITWEIWAIQHNPGAPYGEL